MDKYNNYNKHNDNNYNRHKHHTVDSVQNLQIRQIHKMQMQEIDLMKQQLQMERMQIEAERKSRIIENFMNGIGGDLPFDMVCQVHDKNFFRIGDKYYVATRQIVANNKIYVLKNYNYVASVLWQPAWLNISLCIALFALFIIPGILYLALGLRKNEYMTIDQMIKLNPELIQIYNTQEAREFVKKNLNSFDFYK